MSGMSFKEKFWLVVSANVVIVVVGFAYLSSNHAVPTKDKTVSTLPMQASQSVTSSGELQGIEGVKYSFIKIPAKAMTHLKSDTTYKKLYDSDKKFIVYYTGVGCPYARTFDSAFNNYRRQSGSNQYYNFHGVSANRTRTFNSREAAYAELSFSRACHEFCIVNPRTEEIFSIDGIGENEGRQITSILNQLKNW